MSDSKLIALQPIGVVHSPYVDVVGMPIQTAAAPDTRGHVEVFEAFASALRDIEDFEFIIVLTHLHQAVECLEVTPFLDDYTHGAFATRAPTRPNRIGLSIVRLERVDGRHLHFSGNDMLDQTPVLDIKPYVPQFDVRLTDRIGWFRKRVDTVKDVRADDRMRCPEGSRCRC
jgi:tRNA-Thr(GGU) m(6)t(6)A37 methyltransferase TsaA